MRAGRPGRPPAGRFKHPARAILWTFAAGFVIVEAADIADAAGIFRNHPHITVFPGDGIDATPVVTRPPED
jgi:hypothetical protein